MASEPGRVSRSGTSLAVARIAGQVVPGVEAARAWSAASVRNGGERARMLLPAARGGYGGERETLERLNRERLSTVAGRAVGPARGSGEVPAWRGGGGAKGPAHSWFVDLINRSSREESRGRAEAVRQAV